LKHEKSDKRISIQVDLSFLGKLSMALQLKLILATSFCWKSITNKLKKQKIWLKSWTV